MAVEVKEVRLPFIQLTDGSGTLTIDPVSDWVWLSPDDGGDVILAVEGLEEARLLGEAVEAGIIRFSDLSEVDEANVESHGSVPVREWLEARK